MIFSGLILFHCIEHFLFCLFYQFEWERSDQLILQIAWYLRNFINKYLMFSSWYICCWSRISGGISSSNVCGVHGKCTRPFASYSLFTFRQYSPKLQCSLRIENIWIFKRRSRELIWRLIQMFTHQILSKVCASSKSRQNFFFWILSLFSAYILVSIYFVFTTELS